MGIFYSSSIDNAKIDGAAIGTANIQEGAIVTAHILDGQVTKAKIADLAVDSAKIADFGKTLDLSSNEGINMKVEKVYTDMDDLVGFRIEIMEKGGFCLFRVKMAFSLGKIGKKRA